MRCRSACATRRGSIAFAPADHPTIAVAVMVEHGGFGASTAAPIARKIIDAWLLGKRPEPEANPDGPHRRARCRPVARRRMRDEARAHATSGGNAVRPRDRRHEPRSCAGCSTCCALLRTLDCRCSSRCWR